MMDIKTVDRTFLQDQSVELFRAATLLWHCDRLVASYRR
jgi:hypothetical protein